MHALFYIIIEQQTKIKTNYKTKKKKERRKKQTKNNNGRTDGPIDREEILYKKKMTKKRTQHVQNKYI